MGRGAPSWRTCLQDLNALVIQTALDWQRHGQHAVLVHVARTWGSSPRPPGSVMAIAETGLSVGSVSGGCIEDDLVAQMRAQGISTLCPDGLPSVRRYGVTADQAHRFGLPCGGTVELVLEPVGERSQLNTWYLRMLQRQTAVRHLDLHTGEVSWTQRAEEIEPGIQSDVFSFSLRSRVRLIVIGAGDVSRYLCEMALGMGFDVTVCDPRSEMATPWLVHGVSFCQEMPDDLVLRLQPDARTAVVTLTHDPKLDDLALMEALRSPAFYVGAIGSRQNSALRRERLQTHFGLSDAEMDRLHGPAGLFIGSRTPPEIALSILAEVVAAKNGAMTVAGLTVAKAKPRSEQQARDGALPTRPQSQGTACGL